MASLLRVTITCHTPALEPSLTTATTDHNSIRVFASRDADRFTAINAELPHGL